MEHVNEPHVPSRGADLLAWTAVGVSTVLTSSVAYTTAAGTAELPPWVVATSAAALVGSLFFAAWRHSQASITCADAKDGYDIALASEIAARSRLGFARHAAALMASLPEGVGLKAVLRESLDRFAVDAAAVVGDEVTISTAEGVDEATARAGVLKVALETVEAGRAVAQELTGDGAHALTIPMRVKGQLKNVMVLWRRSRGFSPDDLDGLSLVARIVELSMENLALLGSVRDQLDGTLHMLVDLVEQRLPNYAAYSDTVASYAAALGRFRRMTDEEIEDLRCAALLHDVGMLEVPESILNAPRRLSAEEQKALRGHPAHGAELVRVANFSPAVQEAIRSHHERADGAGYPDGLKADEIPLASRILSVCDAFVALTSDRPHRAAVGPDEAIEALRRSAGTHFDEQVVEDFVHVYRQDSAPEATEVVEEIVEAPAERSRGQFELGPSTPMPTPA